MSIFTTPLNNFGAWLGRTVAPYINDALGVRGNVLARYYTGEHDQQLKIKQNKDGSVTNDNVTQNFTGLAVNRSVSRLFRGGVEWTLPEGADQQAAYLDDVWRVNKKPITLFQFGLHGAYSGTAYIKIRPDAMVDPFTGKVYPSLIVLDPEIVRI